MDQKALGPPPTKVGQSPQPSVTVRRTVTAWSLARRFTKKVTGPLWLIATGKSPLPPTTLPASTVALSVRVKCSVLMRLFGVQPASRGVTTTRRRPGVLGTAVAWTTALGCGNGVAVAVGVRVAVPVGDGVAVAVLVAVGVRVGVAVLVGVAVRVGVLVGVAVGLGGSGPGGVLC